MALAAGTRFGAYQVTVQIGAGGMGEVYRATDTKLKRDVAVKVLPAALASDPDRLARFQREAEVLASLNHPNIAAIHGLEEAGGIRALVMELVEGPTLADRLANGAVPLEEALPIARQIADALEAAHERSIIHRDLKPANIKVRDDGVVKVLDFGLAKALEPAGTRADLSQSPTITSPAMTQAGLILGTAAYMSPEQARGKAVDRRADLWAFGVVLFEMLAGVPAFHGEDVGDTLAAVVKTEVDWKRLPAATPAAIRTLLRRCLRKDPRQRLGDAAAARLEIDDALAYPLADTVVEVPQSRRAALLPITVAVGLSALVIGLAIGAWLRSPPAPAASLSVARLALPLSPGSELADGAPVVISPDGSRVAYVATRGGVSQLHTRLMGDSDARPVFGTEGADNPFFSPDGQWVGFFADGKIKKVSTTSGAVVTLADGTNPNAGGTWGPNDTIVFRGRASLLEIPAAGGAPRSLQTPEQLAAWGLIQQPHFLPGGKAILVSATRPGGSTVDDRGISVLTLETGELKSLVQGGSSPRFLPTGHMTFLRDGTLMAVPLDLDRLELVGTPVEVLAGVRQNFNGSGSFSCSNGGSCVYVAGGTIAQRTVALVDRTGNSRPLPLPPKNYSHPRFSPAGDKLLFWMEQLRCDIEVYDLERGTTTRLVADGDNHYPIWTPDGQRITYESGRRTSPDELRSHLVWQLANGGGSEEILATAQGLARPASLSWSRSGELAFVEEGDLWILSRPGDGKPRPFAPSKFSEMMPAFSPDGRWLAYVSDESGRFEVYVRPFPGSGEKYLISTTGGSEPVWARSGQELFFREGNQLMAVEIVTQPNFRAGRPRLLFMGDFARVAGRISYDVAPDGASFVVVNPGKEDRAATRIDVLLNWHDELKRVVPVK